MSLLQATIGRAMALADEPAHLDLLRRTKLALDTAKRVVVPISDIRRCETQPRQTFTADSLMRLSQSIDKGGQMIPGMIREKPGSTPYELIDGERRWRSIKLIPAERRPLYKADLIEAEDDVIQFLIAGTVNFNREGHTPLETMETIDRMLKLKFPITEIASLLGISEHWAYQIHGLKNLTPKVAKMLDPELPKEKQLPVTAAIQIAKAAPKLQGPIAERVVSREVRLPNLRKEIVTVSQGAGEEIRIREVSPMKQWDAVGNKLQVVTRMLEDIENILKDDTVARIAAVYAESTRQRTDQLEHAKTAAVRIQIALKRKVQKK